MPPRTRKQRIPRTAMPLPGTAAESNVVPIYGPMVFSGPLAQSKVSTHVVSWNLTRCARKRALASPWMKKWIEIAARKSQFSVMKGPDFLIFPQGVAGFQPGWTGHLVIGQSGIYFHTWPEAGWAVVMVIACGAEDPIAALELHLKRWFLPAQIARQIDQKLSPLP